MRIKKVIANSYGEALSRVKSELGENAMVLSTRSIKFNKNQDASQCSSLVEITAAVDNDSHRETVAVAEKISSEKEWMPVNKGGEIRELRTMIASLLTRTDKAKSLGLNETLLPVYEKLIGRGVDDRVAARIFETIHERKQWKEGDPFIGENDLAAVMKGAVKCEGPIRLESARPKVVALVGPTGAGKTTTIAKLAARFALQQKKKVAMVSLDTYRMGAWEQLESYGELMQVPVSLAADRNEFSRIMREHQDKDVILVDTMGKSHRDLDYCKRLKQVLEATPQVEVHLVQSATAQESVVTECFNQFAPLGIDRMLFTKLDEAVHFGLLLNCSVRYRIPFSYFTTGQSVPEDIEVAAQDKVIRLIFN
ncbi:MAG: zeta toxin family protein [Nitrospinaceae bacterium]